MQSLAVSFCYQVLFKSCSNLNSTLSQKGKGDDGDEASSMYDTLRSQLLRLCTKDGTPEQARNSVQALSSLVNPASQPVSDLTSRVRKEKKEFEPLLKALVAPSRLAIPNDSVNPKHKTRIVSILSAIAAIAECAPYAFNSSGGEGSTHCWGERALEFALNSVLLEKDTSSNPSQEEDNSTSGSESDDESPVKSSRKSIGRGSKNAASSTKEISLHCQMMCAAMEVVVAHIRSTIVRIKTDGTHSELRPPSNAHLTEVFNTLIKFVQDAGRLSSSGNKSHCKTDHDQAELRRCAATNILRLCDANLQLEQKYLSPKMWHILSTALLDREISVRESVMEELSCMLTGSGKFRHNSSSYPPSLRFVALVALCADGDGTRSVANGKAANVGRRSTSIKIAATQCIKSLRTTCQATQAQCRSLGKEAEKNFENRLKMKLMPEYCVPYALHLLSFRHETASAGGTVAAEDSSDDENLVNDALISSEAASQKMLKKRLKWIFDPLVQSLGAGADNVRFFYQRYVIHVLFSNEF